MKKLTLSLLTLAISGLTFGQDSKVYHSFRYGAYSEWMFAPTSVTETTVVDAANSGTGKVETHYQTTSYVSGSLVNLLYAFRYNVLEPSENFGLGLNVSPSLGLALSDGGFGTINIPAYLSLNFGAGSTYSTASDIGGYIGIGYEFTKINLYSTYKEEENFQQTGTTVTRTDPITSWSEPMAIAGIRWWSKSDRLMEFSIKYGFGSNGDLPASLTQDQIQGTPKTFQITYGWFINY